MLKSEVTHTVSMKCPITHHPTQINQYYFNMV